MCYILYCRLSTIGGYVYKECLNSLTVQIVVKYQWLCNQLKTLESCILEQALVRIQGHLVLEIGLMQLENVDNASG